MTKIRSALEATIYILRQDIEQEIETAIAEEREACAKTVEKLADSNSSYQLMAKVATAIRARGKKETMPV